VTEHIGSCQRQRGFAARLVVKTAQIAFLVLLLPGLAAAQQIAGTVTDTTGAVLPGVTVEARSPALIEQVRTAVTNNQGQYLIAGLQAGVYSVSFTLTGFNTVVREGVKLTIGFTAQIDGQLAVGSVSETITVAGASPVVDLRNVNQQQVMSREVIDSIPSGKSITGYGLLVPGMVGAEHWGTPLGQDQGGMSVQSRQRMSIHGGNHEDQQLDLNGLDVGDAFSQGANLAFFPDTSMEEMQFQFSGNEAAIETGGVRINMIPKEGANKFSGQFFATGTWPGLQANNIDDRLKSLGLVDPTVVDQVWSFNPNIGGPIVKDKLWFFAGHTSQRAFIFPTGVYNETTRGALVYRPNLTSRSLDTSTAREQGVNVTWQATGKDKLKFYYSNSFTDQDVYLQGRTLGTIFVAPDAAIVSNIDTNTYQVNWIRPHTSRLLFEAGYSKHPITWKFYPAARAITNLPGVLQLGPTIAHRNMSGWLSGATDRDSPKDIQQVRGAVSYVTGRHNFKFGASFLRQWTQTVQNSDSNWTSLLVVGSAPIQASFWGSSSEVNSATSLGLYAQDQWNLGRLTVNAGARFDNPRAGYPDQVRPITTWVRQEFAIQAKTVVSFYDIQPRLGAAYDLFGNGKTALKASISRYGKRESTDWAQLTNPVIVNRQMNRVFNDSTCVSGVCIAGDGLVQGDPLNPLPNGELLNSNPNLAFGQPVINTFLDDDLAFGWGNRAANWEFTTNVQHEVAPNVSVDFGYFRRAWANFAVLDDRTLSPSDFDRFQVVVPNDPRLGSAAGKSITLFDRKPTASATPQNYWTSADKFGGWDQIYNGFDLTIDARVNQVLLQGGMNVGRLETDRCSIANNVPETQLAQTAPGAFSVIPWGPVPLEECATRQNWQTQVKLIGSYTLPYDVQVAATYQDQPGPERQARVTYSGAAIAAVLGRPAVLGQQTVNVLRPGTVFGDRFRQFDLRFTKIFRGAGSLRFRGMFDLYNVFNRNTGVQEEPGFSALTSGAGSLWSPQVIMPGRLAKFAFQLDF
jgi:hypothetical protein